MSFYRSYPHAYPLDAIELGGGVLLRTRPDLVRCGYLGDDYALRSTSTSPPPQPTPDLFPVPAEAFVQKKGPRPRALAPFRIRRSFPADWGSLATRSSCRRFRSYLFSFRLACETSCCRLRRSMRKRPGVSGLRDLRDLACATSSPVRLAGAAAPMLGPCSRWTSRPRGIPTTHQKPAGVEGGGFPCSRGGGR